MAGLIIGRIGPVGKTVLIMTKLNYSDIIRQGTCFLAAFSISFINHTWYASAPPKCACCFVMSDIYFYTKNGKTLIKDTIINAILYYFWFKIYFNN